MKKMEDVVANDEARQEVVVKKVSKMPVILAFFLFFVHKIFTGILGSKKNGVKLSCWTPYPNQTAAKELD